jgi:hypothetical protein
LNPPLEGRSGRGVAAPWPGRRQFRSGSPGPVSHKNFHLHQDSATFWLEMEHGNQFACMVEFDQKASVTDFHAPGLPSACWGNWGTFWSFKT